MGINGGNNCSVNSRYISPKRNMNNDGYSWEDPNKYYKSKKVIKEKKERLRIKIRKGSQGITASIVLIAFLITTAGITFTFLTLGSSFAQKRETISSQAKDFVTSSLELVGGVVTGVDTDNDAALEGLVFSLRMVLQEGEIDFDEDAMEVTIIISNNTEIVLIYNNSLDTIDELAATALNTYGIKYYDSDNDDILEESELGMFFIKFGIDISQNQQFTVFIITSATMFIIEKTAPTSISNGSNMLL